jgi:hypothetical protein
MRGPEIRNNPPPAIMTGDPQTEVTVFFFLL